MDMGMGVDLGDDQAGWRALSPLPVCTVRHTLSQKPPVSSDVSQSPGGPSRAP